MSEWIDIRKTPPPYSEFVVGKGWTSRKYVLVVDAKGRMAIAWWMDYRIVSAKPIGEPTHWMHLPAPPEPKPDGGMKV